MVITSAVAAYLCGVWGIYGHFVVQDRVEPAMKFTSALSLVGLAWFLFARWRQGALIGSTSPPRDDAVLGLLAGFMVLFWWTVAVTRERRLTLAFSKDQPHFICKTGPYRWLRHPFYTSYMIFWVALAIGAGGLAFWLMPAAMLAIYWRAIRLEEAKFAASPMALEYANYRPVTARIFAAFHARSKTGDA
jgi:protein-S-isoprenylcysteine O-methyltransferase Ste14